MLVITGTGGNAGKGIAPALLFDDNLIGIDEGAVGELDEVETGLEAGGQGVGAIGLEGGFVGNDAGEAQDVDPHVSSLDAVGEFDTDGVSGTAEAGQQFHAVATGNGLYLFGDRELSAVGL